MTNPTDEIAALYSGCSYCLRPGTIEDGRACCGELHFEPCVELINGDVMTLNEFDPDADWPDED